jgi:hypothetical protein
MNTRLIKMFTCFIEMNTGFIEMIVAFEQTIIYLFNMKMPLFFLFGYG